LEVKTETGLPTSAKAQITGEGRGAINFSRKSDNPRVQPSARISRAPDKRHARHDSSYYHLPQFTQRQEHGESPAKRRPPGLQAPARAHIGSIGSDRSDGKALPYMSRYRIRLGQGLHATFP